MLLKKYCVLYLIFLFLILLFSNSIFSINFYRGFSVVDLVQDQKTHRAYALKRIVCHSKEDERAAMKEAEYHNIFNSPYILECIDVALVESYDGLHPHRSEVLLLLPYYRVLLFLLLSMFINNLYIFSNNTLFCLYKSANMFLYHAYSYFVYLNKKEEGCDSKVKCVDCFSIFY